MSNVGDDCYFFCTSGCAKGPACPFRHVEAAKTCKIICQHWQMGCCLRPSCKFRHSDFHIEVNTNDIPCYWESQPIGCSKPNCGFKHLKPRLIPSASGATKTTAEEEKSSAPEMTNGESTADSSPHFVRPVVPPIIIRPESEESNSSPVKKAPVDQVQSKEETSDKKDAEQDDNSKIETRPSTEESEQAKTQPSPKKTLKGKKLKTKKVVKKKILKTADAGIKKPKKVIKKSAKKIESKTATPKSKKIVRKPNTKTPEAGHRNNKKRLVPTSNPRRNVKERLGIPAPPPRRSNQKSEESEASSDSDDSIENIKVMSIEEIFRQKALESMMKKRAAEGKPLLPDASSMTKTVEEARPKSAPLKLQKDVNSRLTPKPSSSSETEEESEASSSDENEEVEEDEDREVEEEDEEEKEETEEEASSDSSMDSTDSSESEEDSDALDVRRVVVHVDSAEKKKAARKRAKISVAKKPRAVEIHDHLSLKKIRQGKVLKAKVAKPDVLKRRLINMDEDYSDEVMGVKRGRSIRERLGKPVSSRSLLENTKGLKRNVVSREIERDEKTNLGEGRKRKIAAAPLKMEESEEEEDEDDDKDTLHTVQVKSLQEIRAGKKMKFDTLSSDSGGRKQSDVKKRLGPVQDDNSRDEEDEGEQSRGRQVLLTDVSARTIVADKVEKGSVMDDEFSTLFVKKGKRRPWRSKKALGEKLVGEDERTVSASLASIVPGLEQDDFQAELNRYKEDRDIDDSLYEALRRKMILKKKEALMAKRLNMAVEQRLGDEEVEEKEKETTSDAVKSKHKKHKHKHKDHKKHKRERQIYMPPALKKTVLSTGPSLGLGEMSPPASPEDRTTTNTTLTTTLSPTRVADPVRRRPMKNVAAAWAAGLSLSSKGAGVRPLMSVIPERKHVPEPKVPEESKVLSRITGKVASQVPANIAVKSFSEIMAEKRKRRLELQAQKTGNSTSLSGTTAISSSSSQSSLSGRIGISTPPKQEVKTSGPITPIVFDLGKSVLEPSKPTGQPTIVVPNNKVIPKRPVATSGDASHSTSLFSKDIAQTHTDGTPTFGKAKNIFKKKLKSPPSRVEFATSYESSKVTSPKDKTPSNSASTPKLSPPSASLPHELTSHQLNPTSGDAFNSPSTKSSTYLSGKQMDVADTEPTQKKSRHSIDDEFLFFDSGDFGDTEITETTDVEPIDDLLQDIDDLLA